MARLYFSTELYPEAIESYKTALRLAPGHPEASPRLAWIYQQQQSRLDEAESVFQSSIKRYPDYWATHFELGVVFYYRDQTSTALAQWEKALTYAPDDVNTLSNVGVIYQRNGEWHMAHDYFERAYQANRTCQTCQNMGLVSYFEGKYDEAVKYYTFALQYCDTTKYNTWGNLAVAQYHAEGQRPKSVGTYRIAIRLALGELSVSPEDPVLIAALIDYYTMSGDWNNGSRWIAYGDSVASGDADVRFSSGAAYERHGERPTALRYLGDAIRFGYPIIEIERTPSLQELVQDPVFKQMISEEATGAKSPSSDASSN